MPKNNPADRNYHEVHIPDEKDKKDYTTDERRAYVLQKIIDAGIPSNINLTEIANETGVSTQQVHKDKEIVGDWMSNNLDRDFDEMADSVMRWATRKAIEEEDYRQARRGISEWQSFLQDEGEKDKQPDKLVISDDDSEVGYEVVEEDSDSDE